jgi:hypothetical protein
MDHGAAVTKHYLIGENTLDDGYWDDVKRETLYHENDSAPVGEKPYPAGRVKGEFDVLLVNYEDQTALYKEIKTNRGDLYKAEKQIERAEDHFEDTSWDVIGSTVLEDG